MDSRSPTTQPHYEGIIMLGGFCKGLCGDAPKGHRHRGQPELKYLCSFCYVKWTEKQIKHSEKGRALCPCCNMCLRYRVNGHASHAKNRGTYFGSS